MLQKLGDHITNCLARAEDAERRGLEISDPEAKAETTRMAKAWRHLARSYEFIEIWNVSCSTATQLAAAVRARTFDDVKRSGAAGVVSDRATRTGFSVVVDRDDPGLPPKHRAGRCGPLAILRGHRHLGRGLAGGLGVRDHQLRMVDRDSVGRYVHLRAVLSGSSRMANLTEPHRRNDDGVCGGMRRRLPDFASRARDKAFSPKQSAVRAGHSQDRCKLFRDE